jgi:23S rRNA (cytidine1920-2'-O)/16S rRNA (cytidine1409-2'-O)-methyltransferase
VGPECVARAGIVGGDTRHMGGAEPSLEVFFDLLIGRPLRILEQSYEHTCDFYVSRITYVPVARLPCLADGVPTRLGPYAIRLTKIQSKKSFEPSFAGNLRPGATVPAMKKTRIDAVLAARGLFPSRTAAASAVRAGAVRVGRDGPVAVRPSQLIEPEAALVIEEGPRFASRGGVKLDNALEALAIDVAGRDCLDVGASTGGFTDCLLQRGAARVAAVDVAYGQLDLKLREDPRVTVIERLNARELASDDLPFVPQLATVDVSFISLAKILPAVAGRLAPGGEILAMVKPQFELGRERVGKGVVRDPSDRREAILAVARAAEGLGLAVYGFAASGLPGPKGNRETFVWCGKGSEGIADLEAAIAKAEPS